MFDIYIRKSELLKNEIIEDIKSKLFSKKKILEEILSKLISSSGNIEVKYKNKKFFYNRRVNRLFPDFENYKFNFFNLNEIDEVEKIEDFENAEYLNEDIFKRVFFKEKDKFVDDGRILNRNQKIDKFIIKKNDKLIIIDNKGQEIETKEGFLIPVIKILGIDNTKKEFKEIVKIFEENSIEIIFNDINKRLKEKYEELLELYRDIEKYNFLEKDSKYNEKEILKSFEEGKFDLPKNFIETYIEKLKNIEKTRLDEKEYDDNIFKDYQKGNWDIFSDNKESIEKRELIKISTDKEYHKKNPEEDIKSGGIVAIDFGTKSTVVAIQTQNENVSLVRIAGGSYKKNVKKEQFENPTIMEFLDIENFEKKYSESSGRPFTEWNDLRISYTAEANFKAGSRFVLEGLKQWAGNKEEKLIIYDKKGKRIDLKPFIDVEDEFDPIEYYAYYIGSYINNMFTGNIFTKYLLSFPIKYENKIREKILKSFEKGIKKSLPISVLENKKIMEDFKVDRGANEPTAYFLCAIEELNKLPKEDEKLFYGIFDFGGGTTDFSFGICEYVNDDFKNYDYKVTHFREGGDKYLGGESILKTLAFELCKNNITLLKENNVHFYCPNGCDREFTGYEGMIDNSYEAIYNIKYIAEKFRNFWEEKEDELNDQNTITLAELYDSDSNLKSLTLKFDKDKYEDLINKILKKGIENFMSSLELVFSKKEEELEDINSMEIFLSGNSSKSKRFQKLFEEEVTRLETEILKDSEIKEKVFNINYPIEINKNKRDLEINAKTGTAIGLLESRKGGRFKIIPRNEIRNNDEIDFQFFVGYLKNKKFRVALDSTDGYKNWKKFSDASVKENEIYYMTDNGFLKSFNLTKEDSFQVVKKIPTSTDIEGYSYINIDEKSKEPFVVCYNRGSQGTKGFLYYLNTEEKVPFENGWGVVYGNMMYEYMYDSENVFVSYYRFSYDRGKTWTVEKLTDFYLPAFPKFTYAEDGYIFLLATLYKKRMGVIAIGHPK